MVRLVDLADASNTISGHSFEDCELTGPIVIVPGHHLAIERCTWQDGPAIFMAVPDGTRFVGPCLLHDCQLVNCRIRGVGIMAPAETIAIFKKGFSDIDLPPEPDWLRRINS